MTVVWDAPAQDELARIWLNARDRLTVSHAANRIDDLLRNNPERRGEIFFDDRLLVEPPLAITFSVDLENRLVRVRQVWHLDREAKDG